MMLCKRAKVQALVDSLFQAERAELGGDLIKVEVGAVPMRPSEERPKWSGENDIQPHQMTPGIKYPRHFFGCALPISNVVKDVLGDHQIKSLVG